MRARGKKRIVGITAILIMMMGLIPLVPMKVEAADPPISIDIGTITDGASGTGYGFLSKTLTITGVGPYVITGTTTSNRIVVDNGGSITSDITLSGANIQFSSASAICAMEITNNSKVNLTISGTNILKSEIYQAGLGVGVGNELTIMAGSTGSLNVLGGNSGAGIGGGFGEGAGKVTISGGTVTATGGDAGAGIGGGEMGAGGTTTISGGTVTAQGGSTGAGIGGGDAGAGGTNTITGGSVLASSIDTAPISALSSPVYLTTITIPSNISEGSNCTVKVDNVDFNISQVPVGKKLYLYLPVAPRQVEVTSGGTTYKATAVVSGASLYLTTITIPGYVSAGASCTVKVDNTDVQISEVPTGHELYLYLPVGSHQVEAVSGSKTYKTSVSVSGVNPNAGTLNATPVAVSNSINTPQSTILTGSLSATDEDTGDVANLVYAVGTGPTHGTLSLIADGSFVYRPTTGYIGTDSFTFTVSDGKNTSTPGNVSLSISSGYTVTYDLNSGSGTVPTDSNRYLDGYLVSIKSGEGLTRPHHTFLGWATSPTSTTILTSPYTMGSANLTFYAVWKPVVTPTVITTTSVVGGNVLVTETTSNGVETSDKSPLTLVILVLMLSAAGIIVVALVSKKKNIKCK